VTDSAGVAVVVSDPERPAWPRGQAWRLADEPAIQVGNIPGDPGHQLYGVEHSARLPGGGIVVANGGLGDVRVYDPQGGHVATLALPVEAAGSPTRPTHVAALAGDSLLVVLADGTISVYAPDGVLARTARAAPPEGTRALHPVGVFGNGWVLMSGALPFDTVSPGFRRHPERFAAFDHAGTRVGEWVDFAMKVELVGEGVLVFAPDAHIAPADSTVWYGDAERFEVREVALGGRTLRLARLDRPPDRVTGPDTLAFRHGATQQLESSVGADSARAVVSSYRYGETFPAYDRIVVDALGNVWVRWYGWFELGAEKKWSVFSGDGRYQGDVFTPPLLEIHEIGADFVLGRMATSRGVEAVYVYELIKP
jgi:hypothetical protein